MQAKANDKPKPGPNIQNQSKPTLNLRKLYLKDSVFCYSAWSSKAHFEHPNPYHSDHYHMKQSKYYAYASKDMEKSQLPSSDSKQHHHHLSHHSACGSPLWHSKSPLPTWIAPTEVRICNQTRGESTANGRSSLVHDQEGGPPPKVNLNPYAHCHECLHMAL